MPTNWIRKSINETVRPRWQTHFLKRYPISLLCLLSVVAIAQPDLPSTNPIKYEVQKLLAARTDQGSFQPYDLEQLKALHQAIVGNRQNVWSMPESLRSAISEALEPTRDVARQLAESKMTDERFYGAVLNSYLKPTEESRGLLLKLAHDGRPETAGTAMDTLFGLKLETPELRNQLAAALLEDKPPRDHSTLHSLAMTNVGDWGVHEAVPALIKLLEVSNVDGGPINGPVVRQIRALGPKAKDALPLLRKIALQRRAAGNADFKELEALDFAVQAVGGGSNSPLNDFPKEVSPPANSSIGPADQKTAVVQSKGPIPAISENSTSLPWSIVALLIVTPIGLLWVLFKRLK